ncbi:MAG: ubiquinol oxidase subunit II [Limnobacter sp.]|nr:ubiquinol oxidase subunit II [Limnobacter sp.]
MSTPFLTRAGALSGFAGLRFFQCVKRLLPACMLGLLSGCNTVVMNPSGDVARQQADLILVSTWLMLIIIVPVILLTFFFAWKYRQSNTSATYEPDWDHSAKLELVIWGAPLLIIIVLGLVTWVSTHKLDPYRPLSRLTEGVALHKEADYLEVQVSALDWKWLFIYPEYGIATVNELVTPANKPIRFKITSATVMNSFFIPALAGQIYAMPGMETTLHAVINEPGEYTGFSANYSGAGFSHMRFAYRGVSAEDFQQWVAQVKASGQSLDTAHYLQLEQPTIKHPVERYAQVQEGMWHAIVNRCVHEGSVCMDAQMLADAQRMGSTEDSIAVLLGQTFAVLCLPANWWHGSLTLLTSCKAS